jgi:diacylglycerol kinase (ATP)
MTQSSAPPVREILIFTSPKAGSGAGGDRVGTLTQRLRDEGWTVHVTASLDELRHRCDRHSSVRLPAMVVTAGGDGTLALVAQNTPPATVLVPMPLGTENLVAKHYRITSDLPAMMNVILRGQELQIDAGLANGRLFLVMASCGFDAEVVRAMHLTRQGHISRFSYAWPILRTIRRYGFPLITVEYLQPQQPEAGGAGEPLGAPAAGDRSAVTCRWALVFNLPRYAVDLAVEPDACEDDGVLDLCSLQYGSFFSGARYLGGIVTRRHIRWKDVVRRQVIGCRITSSERVAFQVDGDYAGRLPLEISVLPGRIRLKVAPGTTTAPLLPSTSILGDR